MRGYVCHFNIGYLRYLRGDIGARSDNRGAHVQALSDPTTNGIVASDRKKYPPGEKLATRNAGFLVSSPFCAILLPVQEFVTGRVTGPNS